MVMLSVENSLFVLNHDISIPIADGLSLCAYPFERSVMANVTSIVAPINRESMPMSLRYMNALLLIVEFEDTRFWPTKATAAIR